MSPPAYRRNEFVVLSSLELVSRVPLQRQTVMPRNLLPDRKFATSAGIWLATLISTLYVPFYSRS